jgi:lipid A 3-O-deacylase
VAYHMENGMRLGLGWDHRSNLEIYARNPGVEMVHVRLSIPLE